MLSNLGSWVELSCYMEHSNNDQQTCWHHAESTTTTCLDVKNITAIYIVCNTQTNLDDNRPTETDILCNISYARLVLF